MNENNIISLQSDGRIYYMQAMKKKHAGMFSEARELMLRAHELEPQNREYISELAYLMSSSGQTEAAEQFLIDMFVRDNFDTTYYYDLSEVNIIDEEPNKALLFGMKYVDLYDDTEFYDELFEIFEIAEFDYDEIIEEADEFIGMFIFQTLFMNGNIEASLDFLYSLDIEIQETRAYRNQKAMALLFLNKFEEAQVILETLLEEDQTDMTALSHLTLLYFYTGNMEQYTRFLRKLEVVEPLDEDARLKVGLVLNFLNKSEMSYKLLYPLYKKKVIINFQLLHALAQSSFNIGKEKESRQYWEELQKFQQLDEMHSPWKRRDAREELNRIIDVYLQSDDADMRVLGLFKSSLIAPSDIILGSPMWDLIDGFGTREKLYTAYLYNQLQMSKIDRLHDGLVTLEAIDATDAEMLGFIDLIRNLEGSKNELKHEGETLAFAYMYIYHNTDGDSLLDISKTNNVYMKQLEEAVRLIKQNE
ncbi:tetratricopeptide repeat protein [Phocicoccus pinnipedialis]|uniref:Tetratricopeptide repeat protein n=1 Tax=Phocicoccus pinnipedialis TaxID=110845 RepID=A0A6V7R2K0_9BACL|nr:hypothetical protein [Jeotgalicoccus pinnipedialis]MBP1938796.1 Flp pilus assembly protein TadD [Jeotgalicoccus pinnipedialis]CAD2071576.1 hypothetical protein JEOPIN946_00107 [Jeotgalicoccus pinnipedialis]